METGVASIVGLMRPGTGALPARLLFQRAGMSAAVPGRPRPINIRPPDLLYAKRCNIGRRIDAPEDGRAPDRNCFSNALGQPPQSFPHPIFLPPIFLPLIFLPFLFSFPFAYFCYHQKIICRLFRLA